MSPVEHHLRKDHHAQRMSNTVTIFLTAVLESLTRRLLELAGHEAQQRSQSPITLELLDMAIHNSVVLSDLLGSITISQVNVPARP